MLETSKSKKSYKRSCKQIWYKHAKSTRLSSPSKEYPTRGILWVKLSTSASCKIKDSYPYRTPFNSQPCSNNRASTWSIQSLPSIIRSTRSWQRSIAPTLALPAPSTTFASLSKDCLISGRSLERRWHRDCLAHMTSMT